MSNLPFSGESRCLISREALLHNLGFLRRTVGPDVKLCAIVKANAYGHDAAIVADTLCHYCTDDLEAPLVDCVAVADLDEAAALPELPLPLLILRPIENTFAARQRDRIEQAILQGWTLTVCSASAADDLARVALSCGMRASVQIMLDTGMNRAGVGADRFESLLSRALSLPSLRLTGVYSHFACGECPDHPFTAEQLTRFLQATELCANLPRFTRHIANSGGVFTTPTAHLDLVRPGISLYGIDPTGRPCMDRPLRPVLKWTAPLIGIRDVPAGASIGYGQTHITPHATRIGLVPIGYADGYSRRFSNRAVMMLAAKPAPVVGQVSMDFTMIDLAKQPHAMIGDEVTVIDGDPLSPAGVYRLAELADTIPYEILCKIGPRVRRVAVEVPSVAQETTRATPFAGGVASAIRRSD